MIWPTIIEIGNDEEYALAEAIALTDRLCLCLFKDLLRVGDVPSIEQKRQGIAILRNAQRHLFRRYAEVRVSR